MLFNDKKMYRRVYKALNKYIDERFNAMVMDVRIDAKRRLGRPTVQTRPQLLTAY